jgi:peptidyl-prolyl cis-trans isomerase C
MKTRSRILLSAWFVAAAGCAQNQGDVGANALGAASVATVNGQRIPESVLRVYALAAERRNLDEVGPADRERLLNDLIGVELLRQEAERTGLAGSRTLAAQIELQRLQTLARAVATEYLEKNPPSESDLQRIYDDNLPRLAGQQYKARHILVETRDEAERVVAQLSAGASFAALAAERADGPTGPNGGALDWFTLDSMPAAFADAVRDMTVGAYSTAPVQTEFGFHVILLEDTRRQEPPSLADIRDELVGAAERSAVENYLRRLRESAEITIGQ